MKRLFTSLLPAALLLIASPFAYAAEPLVIEINKGEMVRLPSTASSVIVADPNIADIQVISPRLVYVQAKKVGETSLYAIDTADNTILNTTVEVTHNLSKLAKTVSELMPTADVRFKTVDGGLVMDGNVDSPMESERLTSLATSFLGEKDALVNLIATSGSDQVTLLVKIAEVSRNELKRFGINLGAALTEGNFVFNLLQGRTFLGAANAITRNQTNAGVDNSVGIRYNGGSATVDGVLDALEQQDLISILAEPNLTTTSGKAASFLAGGEFPVPVVDSQGKINVQYKPFGISLKFTPTVLSKDKISLNVSPEVSNISRVDALNVGAGGSSTAATFAIPSIQTRRAETTVELGSGQTFAIAGLLKNDRSNNIEKFPGLGDVPVLGGLFRSQNFQNDQTELVILVTPLITRAVDERTKLATPLDGYVPATDLQGLLYGKLYQEQPSPSAQAAAEAEAPALHGGGGYILD